MQRFAPSLRPHPSLAASTAAWRACEFFSGIGLVRLALEADIACVYANDNDPGKQQMYADNFGHDHLDPRSICDVRGDDLPDADLWTASFPCNDTSIAGRYVGLNGRRSGLVGELFRLARERGRGKPKAMLLENVVGLLQKDGGRGLRQVLVDLNDLGYAVDVLQIDAKRWVPQSRKRIFIVAALSEAKPVMRLPVGSVVRPDGVVSFIAANHDLRWLAFDPVLPPDRRPRLDDILEDLPDDDDRWWSRERADYLWGQFSERHLQQAIAMRESDAASYATVFRRVRHGRSMAELRTDGIAGCLRTPRGGSGRQILFRGGHGRFGVRLLTPRECARLQGVPDDYAIKVGPNAALFGFGDAVCVPAVRWLVREYVMTLLDRLERKAISE